ncbi:MAG TPA: hypothetical protein VI953_05060 [Candidatus Paceibacterota bacterium]
MTQKNNYNPVVIRSTTTGYNLEQDLHSLKIQLAPRSFSEVGVTTAPVVRYSYIESFRMHILSYAPLAIMALLIVFVGFKGLPADGSDELAMLDAWSTDESSALTEMSFDEELSASDLELDFMDQDINN